jgi:hypothetical protein
MGEKVENNYEKKFKNLLEELRKGSTSELIKLRYGMEKIREALDLYGTQLLSSVEKVKKLALVLERLEKYDISRLREEDRRFLGETIAESLEEFANALRDRKEYFIRSLAGRISEIEEEFYRRLLSQQQYQLGGAQQQGYQAQKAQTSPAQQQYQPQQAAQTPTSPQPSAQGQQYQPQQAAQTPTSPFLTFQEWENAKKESKLYDLKGKKVKSRTIEGEIIDIDTTLTQYGLEPSIIIKTKEGEELSYSLSRFEKKFLYRAHHNDKSYRVVILLLVVVGLLAFVSFSTLSSVSSFFSLSHFSFKFPFLIFSLILIFLLFVKFYRI